MRNKVNCEFEFKPRYRVVEANLGFYLIFFGEDLERCIYGLRKAVNYARLKDKRHGLS